MRELKLTVPETYDGAQMKAVLKKQLGISSGLLKALKDADGITLNGVQAYVSAPVHTGDTLSLCLPETQSETIEPAPVAFDILFEDADLLVVNKPARTPTHPSLNHRTDTLANGICYYYKDSAFTFRAVNRLDKDTSGIVLVAKNRFAAEALARQVREQQVQKAYLALCCGRLPQPKGIVDAPIARDIGILKRRVDLNGQSAQTRYEVLAQNEALSLIRVLPLTGRTHQIRVHMAYMGAPLYGDFLYGTRTNSRTMLHCHRLTFAHPLTKAQMTLTAPLPADFKDLLAKKIGETEF